MVSGVVGPPRGIRPSRAIVQALEAQSSLPYSKRKIVFLPSGWISASKVAEVALTELTLTSLIWGAAADALAVKAPKANSATKALSAAAQILLVAVRLDPCIPTSVTSFPL